VSISNRLLGTLLAGFLRIKDFWRFRIESSPCHAGGKSGRPNEPTATYRRSKPEKSTDVSPSGGGLELWYNSYTKMRFHFDQRKSKRLRAKSERGIGFEEAQEIFSHPYYLDQRSDIPEQYRPIGWVGARL
jgi:hypothetical protein